MVNNSEQIINLKDSSTSEISLNYVLYFCFTQIRIENAYLIKIESTV